MKIIKNFLLFWYHFVVGDDWRIAVGVGIGFIVDAVLANKLHLQLWWLMPIIVVGILTFSLSFEIGAKK
jgi:hypothetical protein